MEVWRKVAETNALTALVIGIDNTSHGWLRKVVHGSFGSRSQPIDAIAHHVHCQRYLHPHPSTLSALSLSLSLSVFRFS